jgi:asparagine synthetase B (glutamine-hydrolysing)
MMWRCLWQRRQRLRCHGLDLQIATTPLEHQQRRHKCIAVAMSGGIDSSVAALLLQEQGHRDLVGVFMTNWDSSDEVGEETCSISRDREHMREVCARLGIEAVDVSNISSSSMPTTDERASVDSYSRPTVSLSAMNALSHWSRLISPVLTGTTSSSRF